MIMIMIMKMIMMIIIIKVIVCLYHSLHPEHRNMYCSTVGEHVNTNIPGFSSVVLPYRCSGLWPWLTAK